MYTAKICKYTRIPGNANATLCASHAFVTLEAPAGKGLTTWLSFVMLNCVFVTFPCGILCQVWYLIVSIPDLCPFNYIVLSNVHCPVFSFITPTTRVNK